MTCVWNPRALICMAFYDVAITINESLPNGPNTVSVCDIATYSSSGSTGAGGRALTYRYRVTSEYDTTAILTVIQAMPVGTRKSANHRDHISQLHRSHQPISVTTSFYLHGHTSQSP